MGNLEMAGAPSPGISTRR